MKRPHPHEIHESDLDGDEYFVCWDEKLVPETEQRPMKTVKKEKVETQEKVTIENVREAFASNDAIMGQVNNTFMKWADLSPKGANSKECKELADIFAKSVDGAKHGGVAFIPEHLNARVLDGRDKPNLVQHTLFKKVKEQPYRSAYDKLVRYEGLNCRLRTVPRSATYYLADLENSSSDFFAMIKYGIFASRNEDFLAKLNKPHKPSLVFGESVIVIAFQRVKKKAKDGKEEEDRAEEENNNAKKDEKYEEFMQLIGLCQICSEWQPFEWQESPFSFSHQGAFVAKWLYCREFKSPEWIRVSSNRGRVPLSTLRDGDEVEKATGDALFSIFSRQPCQDQLPYAPGPTDCLVTEEFGAQQWAIEEQKLQKHVRNMRQRYQPQQKVEVKSRKPKN